MNGRGTGMSPDGRFNLRPVDGRIDDPYGEGRGVTDGYISGAYLEKVLIPSVYECNTHENFITLLKHLIIFMESNEVEFNLDLFYEAFADRLINTTAYHVSTGIEHGVSERLRSLWRPFFDPETFVPMLSSGDWLAYSSYSSGRYRTPSVEGFRFNIEDTADFEDSILSYIAYYNPSITRVSTLPSQADDIQTRTASALRSMISQTHYRFQGIKEELHIHKIRDIRESYARDNPVITAPVNTWRSSGINYWELIQEPSRGFTGLRFNEQDVHISRLNLETEPGSATTLNISVLIQPGRDILGITNRDRPPAPANTTYIDNGENSRLVITGRVPEPTPAVVISMPDNLPDAPRQPNPENDVSDQGVVNRRNLDL